MSIVEKAVAKLKTLPVESSAPIPDEPRPQQAVPTVERAQERARESAQPVITAAPSHVDIKALKRIGLLPSDDEAERQLSDELRSVKRPLLANAIGKGSETFARGKRIMVTSAEPAEGKTFTAVNLALSLARETDYEVLLVDGDIPKSDVTHAFGLSEKPGLMDLVADESMAPAEVIFRTDVPNLLVVPAGKYHPLAAELFRSRRMEHVLDELDGRNRRRLLVFDSSPLLATSESQVLASHMGQIVMVVAASRTRRQTVTSALRRLNELQYVGLLLNMSRLPAAESYNNSHSYYLKALKGGA
ncbi:AAA family ATPase [Rhodanobacter sp. AS-Z3]|uniref:AAA family ATPase n=1 Tax=Rhodanobacter sp. AS-Z3 TaxID=3031330 RepID=UPI0024794E5C|nr:AAA family ATPase [Rhodanobacter sp. AS-Z3]WEN15385.1 AAA family ATPase [Rhodanobacter sp. AS-Z3]